MRIDLKKMVGAGGFEPPMPVPKTGALPLGYAPTKNLRCKILLNLVHDRDYEHHYHLLIR